jgi:flagellar basal-body rod modification protein FlgD
MDLSTVTTYSATGTSSTSTSSSSSDSASAFGDYESFLQLLITQMQNQNPLDPMDTTEYMSQLVQYAQVEQSLKTNSYLEQLVSTQQSNVNTGTLGYLGQAVSYEGDTATAINGTASWSYTLDEAANVTLTVSDADGNVVYSGTQSANAGTQSFTWDAGSGADGDSYTLSVSATNSSGQPVSSSITAVGLVTGVDTSGDEPSVTIGDQQVATSLIKSVTYTGN